MHAVLGRAQLVDLDQHDGDRLIDALLACISVCIQRPTPLTRPVNRVFVSRAARHVRLRQLDPFENLIVAAGSDT